MGLSDRRTIRSPEVRSSAVLGWGADGSVLDRRDLLGGLAATLGLAGHAAAAPVAPLVLEARPDKAGPAYNGSVPGPLIRIRLGEAVAVTLGNGLEQPTTLTWHGVRIANAMDGVAGLTQPAVPPGGSFAYRFTPPDAGTFWYHPHAAPSTAEQTGRGLRGVLIVDELAPPEADEDILLVLGDIWPDPGPAVTVNDRAAPLAREVRPGARLRLRLVNACPSRIAIVGVTGAAPSVIAVDGQPSELFRPAGGSVPIGPGERFELMLDVPAEAGAKVVLVLRGGVAGHGDQPLLVVTTVGRAMASHPPIAKLPPNPLLPQRIALEKASRHDVAIAGTANGRWSVNGVEGMPARPLFVVARNTPVTLTLRNRSDVVQPMHVHGHCWRLLHDLDDGWDPYWRDSVLLAPGRTKHVAFVADNPGRWALVSGDLRRQDAGLSTWFEVK